MTVRLTSAWCDDRDIVHLISRDERGEVVHRRAKAKWTFFVAGLDDDDRAALARDRRIVGVVADREYTRVDCKSRWAREEVLKAIENAASSQGIRLDVREGDVRPIRRMMTDSPLLEINPDPRLVYLDIETDSRRSFDAMKSGHARILSWAIVGEGVERAEVLNDDDDRDERTLLAELFRALEPFDVVLAWNGDGFDFPVIRERSRRLGVENEWHRWCWLDHLEVFRKYNAHSDDGGEAKVSFKLDHVAHYLLGEGKHDFDASKTWEAWKAGGEERERLVRYNLQDTKLLARIEGRTGFLSLHIATCAICNVFPDTESLNATVQGDGFLLRLGAERGYRFPSKKFYEEGAIPEKFLGAFVMEPTRVGAVDDVHVCDFAGLYPSIMRTFNMSIDTKVTGQRLPPDVPTCQLPGRTTRFRLDRDGIFRVALDALVAKRAEYTAAMKRETPGTDAHAMYKRLSGAFKIVANSFYGIVGSPFSRYFDREIAEGVTQTGKWLLERTIKEAKLAGFDPFYADTDSCFVQGDGEKFAAFVKDLNSRWTDIIGPFGVHDRHYIDLDFEKSFRRILMVSAKRYAASYATYKGQAADPNAKPEVKGLEFKRGDTVRLARQMQAEAVTMLLAPELPPPGAMREFYERWRSRIFTGDLSMDDVTLTQSLTKPIKEYANPGPMHAQVARAMIERGEPLAPGARVAYVIAGDRKKHKPIPASDPDALASVNRDYYWEHRIYPPTQRLLGCVYGDAAWKEGREVKRQRALQRAGQGDLFSGHAPPAGGPRVTIKVDGNDPKVGLGLRAIRAAAEMVPGPVPLTVEMDLGRGTRAIVPTGLGVEATTRGKRALARAAGRESAVTWDSEAPLHNRKRKVNRHASTQDDPENG